MSVPRLGQKLSLISKSNIKYEGTLSKIDAEENTLTLANVTMFGTEDRPAAKGFLPRSESIYEYIVFRGNDIKDLTVFNNPNLPPADPAIVTVGPPKAQGAAMEDHGYSNQHRYNQPPSYGQYGVPSHQQQRYEKERVRPVQEYGNQYQRGNNNYGGWQQRNSNYNRQGGGGGGGNYRRGGGRGRRDNYASHTGLEFASATKKEATMEMKEFDFGHMQEQVAMFEKEKSETVAPVYKKEAGFFDSLAGDSSKGDRTNVDKDTFGNEARGRGYRGGGNAGKGRGGR